MPVRVAAVVTVEARILAEVIGDVKPPEAPPGVLKVNELHVLRPWGVWQVFRPLRTWLGFVCIR